MRGSYMSKKYTVPNRENDNNYMLDTTGYNHIIISAEKMNIVKKSVSYGFRYYSTALQDIELSGKGAKTYNGECISETLYIPTLEFKQKIDIVNKELDVHLVPEIASCMRDHSRLATTVIDASVKSMWYRFSRREDDYCIECSADGLNFDQMRICHMRKGDGKIQFGIYACSPEESSFKAIFTDMQMMECQWRAHEGQQPDEN